MNALIESAANIKKNGNGLKAQLLGEVCGRGVRHRVFNSEHDRLDEAVDVLTRVRPYVPTVGEVVKRYKLDAADLRAHMKRREAEQAQAITEIVNDAPVEITDATSVEPSTIATAMLDTPEVRVFLRRFAASLGCQIKLLDEEPRAGLDHGPYVLVCGDGYHLVWKFGLPIEGIADALECLAREQRLPRDRIEEAWANFGKTWRW